MENFPLEDRTSSAFTGWTRAHWEAVADNLLAAARRHSSPEHANVSFPSAGPQSAEDQLEGFARTFLLAAMRLAGSLGQCPGIVQWYGRALDAGTAPDSPERWPELTDHGQPSVEATAIVLALHWSRPWIWNTLPRRVQDNVAMWLAGARHSYGADNNHVLFSATIQAFLCSVGYAYDAFEIEGALARIEDWYVGDGWYSDGVGRRFDHYNAWTFHLYPFFIFELLDEPDGTGRRELYRSRLAAFVTGYQHLFGADGSPLLQGRSLIYRWGVVAPFWMAELQGIGALSPGLTRRLASGTLRHFIDRGAVNDGVLGLGWHRNHASILQTYNAPGSPHWTSKGFLGLLLPADHPAWTAAEEPLPVERGNTMVTLAGPRWLVTGNQSDGIIRVLNFGSDGHPQKDEGLYRRLAFSTATVPTLETAPRATPLRDNDVYLRHGNSTSRHRGLRGGVARPWGGSSSYSLDAAGRDVTVDYASTVLNGVEVRVARLSGVIGLSPIVSGYAISSDKPISMAVQGAAARASGERRSAIGQASSELMSAILLLPAGEAAGFQARCVEGPSTALGEYSALPLLEFDAMSVNTVRLAWLVGLGASAATLAEMGAGLELSWSEGGAQVQWEGTHRVLPWQREKAWPADQANQGVFRWSPTAPV